MRRLLRRRVATRLREPRRLLAPLTSSSLVILLSACNLLGHHPDKATIRVYSTALTPIAVRVVVDTTSTAWLLPGNDDVELVFIGESLPDAARVEFLDPSTCQVLGVGTSIPRNARVGFQFGDPGSDVTVVQDEPGTVSTISLARFMDCG